MASAASAGPSVEGDSVPSARDGQHVHKTLELMGKLCSEQIHVLAFAPSRQRYKNAEHINKALGLEWESTRDDEGRWKKGNCHYYVNVDRQLSDPADRTLCWHPRYRHHSQSSARSSTGIIGTLVSQFRLTPELSRQFSTGGAFATLLGEQLPDPDYEERMSSIANNGMGGEIKKQGDGVILLGTYEVTGLVYQDETSTAALFAGPAGSPPGADADTGLLLRSLHTSDRDQDGAQVIISSAPGPRGPLGTLGQVSLYVSFQAESSYERNTGEHILEEPKPRTVRAFVRDQESGNLVDLDENLTRYIREELPKRKEVVFHKKYQKDFFNETQAELLKIQWVATNREDVSEGYWGTVPPSPDRIYASYFGRYECADGVHLDAGDIEPLVIAVSHEGISSSRPQASLSGELLYLFHMPSSIHGRLSETENIEVVTGQSTNEWNREHLVNSLPMGLQAGLLNNGNHSFHLLGANLATATYEWQDPNGDGFDPLDQPEPYKSVSDDVDARLVHSMAVNGDVGIVSTHLMVTPGGDLPPGIGDRNLPRRRVRAP